MNKSLKCIISFFIYSISTLTFANSTVTMRICLTGNTESAHKEIAGLFSSTKWFSDTVYLDSTSLDSDYCVEKQNSYQKHTNKAIFKISAFDYSTIIPDGSCRTVAFREINSKNGYCPYTTFKVNNGYGKMPVNWTAEYDIKAEVDKPIMLSCKTYINNVNSNSDSNE